MFIVDGKIGTMCYWSSAIGPVKFYLAEIMTNIKRERVWKEEGELIHHP